MGQKKNGTWWQPSPQLRPARSLYGPYRRAVNQPRDRPYGAQPGGVADSVAFPSLSSAASPTARTARHRAGSQAGARTQASRWGHRHRAGERQMPTSGAYIARRRRCRAQDGGFRQIRDRVATSRGYETVQKQTRTYHHARPVPCWAGGTGARCSFQLPGQRACTQSTRFRPEVGPTVDLLQAHKGLHL